MLKMDVAFFFKYIGPLHNICYGPRTSLILPWHGCNDNSGMYSQWGSTSQGHKNRCVRNAPKDVVLRTFWAIYNTPCLIHWKSDSGPSFTNPHKTMCLYILFSTQNVMGEHGPGGGTENIWEIKRRPAALAKPLPSKVTYFIVPIKDAVRHWKFSGWRGKPLAPCPPLHLAPHGELIALYQGVNS